MRPDEKESTSRSCLSHEAVKLQLHGICKDLDEVKGRVKELEENQNEIKSDLIKKESFATPKILIGILTLVGTIITALGSVIGNLVMAYMKGGT